MLFLSVSCIGVGQAQTFQEKTIEYLTANGTKAQYSDAYDQMFGMLKQQFANQEVLDMLWKELQENKTDDVTEIVTLLSSVYQKYFSETEINQLLAFYKTDGATQMMESPGDLSEEQKGEIATFFSSKTGKKVSSIREKLIKDVSQISEFWSRDLYKKTIAILQEKGYQPPN